LSIAFASGVWLAALKKLPHLRKREIEIAMPAPTVKLNAFGGAQAP
jgi:hypothetical protein